jgi:4-diphosphocytidyl-2-C-methyl-D-erythritol kinase
VIRAPAPAKINLALVVGPRGADGRHELATVLQRVDLGDRVALAPSRTLRISGFPADTLVRRALEQLAGRAGVAAEWSVRITKRIPIAAGLGGGSSDAATALLLANASLPRPLPPAELAQIAATIGADVPFFLRHGPQLGTGDGTELAPLDLPQDFWILLLLPHGERKASTASIYERFDGRGGEAGYPERRAGLAAALERVGTAADLGALPRNDLASSPLARELEAHGAFRADVTGAGPAVYGLFLHQDEVRAAARAIRRSGRVWLTAPCWYGGP